MLLVIVMMLAIALISLTAMAPYEVTEIRRDREDELIRRGKAYSRAIKLFYKRFGRYPISLSELQNTQNVHFIRKLYKDPMAPDGQWRLIHYGESKYPPKGFGLSNIPGAQSIGSPIGSGPAGTPGPTGGAILPGGMGSILGGSSSPLGGSSSPLGGSSSTLGGSSPSSGNQPNTGGMTPADQISKPIGLGSGPGVGAPIIGVASTNTSVGIHEVNERKKYNEWEFIYDPRYDIAAQMTVVPGNVGGAMPGSPTQQVSPFSNTFGQSGGPGTQGGGAGQPGPKQ